MELLFHTWRSFHFGENAEAIDAFVQRIRQVAAMLNHSEPQNLEVFENTLPLHIHCIILPIENLRRAVETARRILTTEELDRQLTGQSTGAPPFLTMKEDRMKEEQ